jgi:hypothetical protein
MLCTSFGSQQCYQLHVTMSGEVNAELNGRPQIVFFGSVDVTHNVWQLA